MVPFAPDPDFVDRPEILAWAREKCAGPGARAALVGLGGVGYVDSATVLTLCTT
jgi:anti-anti-sigma regulatory factor